MNVRETITQVQVVAIVRSLDGDADALVASARAVAAAGFPVVEVTLNSPGALEAIGRLAAHDDMVVGAGTVLEPRDVAAVAEAGGRFVVSPDVHTEVIAAARDGGLEPLPGAWTPTEVRTAVRAGARLVKLFPADVGGPQHLAALRAPFDDVAFVPTGGVGIEDVRRFLDLGAAAVGLGSALVGPTPDETTDRARRLRVALGDVRHASPAVAPARRDRGAPLTSPAG